MVLDVSSNQIKIPQHLDKCYISPHPFLCTSSIRNNNNEVRCSGTDNDNNRKKLNEYD